MADKPVSPHNIYEASTQPHGDAYTFLEFNTQGDDYDYPEFTELSQPIRSPVWVDGSQPSDANDLIGVTSGLNLNAEVGNDGNKGIIKRVSVGMP
jgi:hypothetical protein